MSTDTRQRTYDWDDSAPTAFAGLDQDGLSVLRAIGAGEPPLPPAVRTLGIEPFGIIHGGVPAAVMDTAMGALLTGGPLVCTGEVVHQAASTMVASARIVDADERVIAIAGATCPVRRS